MRKTIISPRNLLEQEKKILVALDRDGTLIRDEDGYFGRQENWKEKIQLYPGAADAIKILNDFAKVIVATNQIGVARGFFGPERAKDINNFIDGILRNKGAKVDGWYFSPYVELEWAKKNGLNLNTPWVLPSFPETRKPEIGMLKSAAADSGKPLSFYKKIFVIGNSMDDMMMGINAKGVAIFFENGQNGNILNRVLALEVSFPKRIFSAPDLVSAAEIVKKLI